MAGPGLFSRVSAAVSAFRASAASPSTLGGLRYAIPGQFLGARSNRQSTRGWGPGARSPNSDTLGDQLPLRARARDAVRNFPLAKSTIITYVACGIGTGLMPAPRIDREYLGLDDTAKEVLERQIVREWRAWSTSMWSSFDGAMAFNAQQRLSFASRLVNGDHWVIKRRREHPGMPYSLSLQHVEADLVSTPIERLSDDAIQDGVEFDRNGVAVAIHVANHYPHDPLFKGAKTWARVPIYDADNRRQVLHVVGERRSGQARGVTLFSAALETLKALSDFADNELNAAINDSIFTVVLKSPRGAKLLPDLVPIDPNTGLPITTAQLGATGGAEVEGPPKVPLSSGNVVNLYDDESIDKIESGRNYGNFASYDTAMTQKYAAAVGLPHELIMRHFTASFSASKGAIIEGWRVIRMERAIDIECFAQWVWEWFLEDLAASGRVAMPGFFDDHLAKAAYCRVQWSGPVPGHLNPLQEVNAAKVRVAEGFTTIESESTELNGSSWEENHGQSVKERRARVAGGLVEALPGAPAPVDQPPPDPTLDEFGDPITPETP